MLCYVNIMSIAENIISLRKEVPAHVKIIAVTKTKPVQDILEAYNAGQRAFGENRVQELLAKQPQLPSDIEWHLIGHLQTNKVKAIVPFVHMIHSVDSLILLAEINKEALKVNRVIDCLLQIRIAKEETKYGMSFDDALNLLALNEFRKFTNVRLKGLMGIATFTDNAEIVRQEFDNLGLCFRTIKDRFFSNDPDFKEISMGMSGDFRIGIQAGSTMIRVGTLIFGERRYGEL